MSLSAKKPEIKDVQKFIDGAKVTEKPTEKTSSKASKEKRVILSVYLTEEERDQVNAYMENLRISASAWVRMKLVKEGILKAKQ